MQDHVPRLDDDQTDRNEDEVEMIDMDATSHDHDPAPTVPLIAREPRQHETGTTPQTRGGNAFIWTLTLAACVGGLLFGYDTGVISSTLVSIGTDLSHRPLTSLDKGLITASTSFFALIASPIAGWLADRAGRKSIIICSDALFTAGALWQAITTSVWGMILGRSVVGLAIGGASMIVPLYIAELAPGHLRGRLTTVQLLLITGGQAIAYIVGWGFSSMPGGWRWMVGIGAFPALTQLCMLVFMPETPRYLVRVGQEEKARQILKRVYRSTTASLAHTVDITLGAIQREIIEEEEAAAAVIKDSGTSSNKLPATLQSLVFYPPHARALAIACLLQGLQQACGFNSLMYFSATIFSLLGFKNPTLTSLTIALTNFAFTVVAFYLIDRIGRRKSLLYTIPIMILSLILAAGAFRFIALPDTDSSPSSVRETPPPQAPHYLILVALMLYVSSYATGLGPVPWQQSELFPLSVRSLGSSLSTATNWALNTVVGLTFLPMMRTLTPTWTFVVYAGICCIGLMAIWWCYPETMGMEIEEVGGMLKRGWGVNESMERLKRMRRAERGRS